MHALALNALLWAAGAALVTFLAETFHARRIARASGLLQANSARPAAWTRRLPHLRTALAALLAWALALLAQAPPSLSQERGAPRERHLVVLLDVSPSMLIRDAGEAGTETRAARAAHLLTDLLNRIPGSGVRHTLAAFYDAPQLLIQNSTDRNLLQYMASELPLHILYKPAKTDLLQSLNQLPALLPEMPYRSASLVVFSDGDTVAQTGLHPLPNAFTEVLVVGVGKVGGGTFIDDHNSQQDAASLGTLARRLKGRYADCNQRPLPADALAELRAPERSRGLLDEDWIRLAKVLAVVASAGFCLLPLCLQRWGIVRPKTVPAHSVRHPWPEKMAR